jgi:hypothetical protein
MSMGAWETNMPERETAAVRRDREPLTSAAQEQRQEETAVSKHQTAGESASSSGGETANPGVPHTVCPGAGTGDQVDRGGCQPDVAKAAQVEPPPTDPETGEEATRHTCGLRPELAVLLKDGSDLSGEDRGQGVFPLLQTVHPGDRQWSERTLERVRLISAVKSRCADQPCILS